MGHVRSKTMSLCQILKKNLVYAPEATFLVRLSRNLAGMYVLIKSRTSLKMAYVGSKTRLLGLILEKNVYALEATFSVQ